MLDTGTWRRFRNLILLALPVAFVIGLLGTLNIVKAEESLEYQLAAIDAGRSVPEDDITVVQFRGLLSDLSSDYVENKQQIADMSAVAQMILEENGIKESLLNIMVGMRRLVFSESETQQYAICVAAYVALRNSGESHSGAINELRTMYGL